MLSCKNLFLTVYCNNTKVLVVTGITQEKYSSKTLASELQNLPEPRASLNSAYESSDIDENIILELPLNNLLCLLEAPKDGNEGRNARSGYQTCIDFIRTHYIVNEQEINSKSIALFIIVQTR